MIAPSKSGFSLLEVVAALIVFASALGLATTGYLYAMKNASEDQAQDELDLKAQLALEYLKKDLRLSSLDQIHYHPEGPGPYTAISFPLAYDSDGDNILEKNSDGSIIWDETIIYHIRPNTPDELVRTSFAPRDNRLTAAQRQAQLDGVVTKGSGAEARNGGNAYSKVLFKNLMTWEIRPQAGQFDTYAASPSRETLNLGYFLLDGGEHTLKFDVIGRNDTSTGHEISIDQILLSGPTIEFEAENLEVVRQSGAKTEHAYRLDGASGNHELLFPATAKGQSFSLSFNASAWEESTFRAGSDVLLRDTRIHFDEHISPKEHVVMLKGLDNTWEASLQTGSPGSNPSPTSDMRGWTVRVLQKGAELADNGSWLAYNGRKCRLSFAAGDAGQFKIMEAFIGESSSAENASFDFAPESVRRVTFKGQKSSPLLAPSESVLSDWVDLPIDKDKNYLVSYRVSPDGAETHAKVWPDLRAGSAAVTTQINDKGNPLDVVSPAWPGSTEQYKGVIGLQAIEVSYPISGTYESRVFDTGLQAPLYNKLDWKAEVPPGTDLTLKVRTGNEPDLSDAEDWSVAPTYGAPKELAVERKRYIQFQATLTSNSEGLATPRLRSVMIDWDAPPRLVNIGGVFAMRPNNGIARVEVDGASLRSALMVDLEIHQDVRSTKRTLKRITSSMSVDVTPRNTGM